MRFSANGQVFVHLLRATAAQIVVIGHSGSAWGVLQFLEPPYAPYMQNLGVLVFFTISGFVICYSTMTKRAVDPSYSFADYFVERFTRIYCGLIPALLFV